MKKIVLALACLLIAASHVSAQSESQAMNVDSLAGLKGISLTVMFGRADALDEAKRPAVLKLLQSDARERFKKAGIPLLEYAQEIENEPGSPRFMVIIILDKPNGHVYPVVVESKLVQDVRLSRDPSIQASVTTWTSYSIGGGYEITDTESLRRQIGGDVDHFIQAYRSVNPNRDQLPAAQPVPDN